MARPLKNLTCPFCRSSRTSRPLGRQNATSLQAEYQCDTCGNTFFTVEAIARADLGHLFVQRPATGNGPPPEAKPFQETELEADLRMHLRKMLTEAQRRHLVESVVEELGARLPKIAVTNDDDGSHTLQAIDVRLTVQYCLAQQAERAEPHQQEQFEAAHVLYAMTAVGFTVEKLIDFVEEKYERHAVRAADAGNRRPQGSTRWYRPEADAARPTTVVKNFRRSESHDQRPTVGAALTDRAALRERRPREPFALNKFDRSIRQALGTTRLVGSLDLDRADEVANLREWVLWSVQGEPIVRASQLAAHTASILRRASPLAYLRWVTLGKELSVPEIFLEAVHLQRAPSRPVIFDPDPLPTVHSTDVPGE